MIFLLLFPALGSLNYYVSGIQWLSLVVVSSLNYNVELWAKGRRDFKSKLIRGLLLYLFTGPNLCIIVVQVTILF